MSVSVNIFKYAYILTFFKQLGSVLRFYFLFLFFSNLLGVYGVSELKFFLLQSIIMSLLFAFSFPQPFFFICCVLTVLSHTLMVPNSYAFIYLFSLSFNIGVCCTRNVQMDLLSFFSNVLICIKLHLYFYLPSVIVGQSSYLMHTFMHT